MKNVVIYIHGKYGTAEEAEYYRKFFNETDIIGFEYTSEYPWDFQKEFSNFIDNIYIKYKKISIIANSIGAYFTMLSLTNKNIEKAFFYFPYCRYGKTNYWYDAFRKYKRRRIT